MFVTWDTFFTPEVPSIARELNQLGYTTSFVGKWHNGEPEMADPKHIHREYGDDPELLQAKLEELGIADNTLVIFTSDHQSRGKFSVYESCRVPAVAIWPEGIEPGTIIDDICANIDLLLTAVDLAGGGAPDSTDGLSFRENLLTGSGPDAYIRLYATCAFNENLL